MLFKFLSYIVDFMIISQNKIKLFRCLCMIFLVILPLIVLPGIFTKLKFSEVLKQDKIEEALTFGYRGNRHTTCYSPGSERNNWDTDTMCYVFLPSYADLEAISVETQAPRVEFESEHEVITVSNKKDSLCAFEEKIPYIVHFYDAGGQEVGTKSITFLKSGKLPTLYVTTQTGSMEFLDADKSYKEKGYAELVDVDGQTLFSDELKNISGRGNHTFTFDKKSYQMKLREAADLLGMGKSNTWILLSNVFDNSYIRNKLTYDMALQAGMEGSPESKYIDVYFNGSYHGMYLLTEKVQFGENRLDYPDLESQNRDLNGDNLDQANPFEDEKENQKGVELFRNPDDITGGYLIEHDYGPKYEEEFSGFITDEQERFVLKNPEHASREEVAYIAGLMRDIEAAIKSEDGYSPHTGKHFTEYIDLESWADKYLVEEITANTGGGCSSSYFYKLPNGVSEKVFGGPVWDYDKAYARSWDYSQNPRILSFLTLHGEDSTRWFYYLYQHEEFVEAVKKEYKEKFSNYLEQMGSEKADEYLAEIGDSAALDLERFSYIYRDYGSDLDYLSAAQSIKQFILERKQFFDSVWLQDASVCQIHFLEEDGREIRDLGVIQGESIVNLPEEISPGEEFVGWQIEGTEELLTEQTVITRDMTVIALWK